MRKIILLLTVATATFGVGVAGHAFGVQNQQAAERKAENVIPEDKYVSEHDQQINVAIRKAITGWVTDDYKNIVLHTSGGIVSVSGHVSSEAKMKKLIDEVKKVDGVIAVKSNVVIE